MEGKKIALVYDWFDKEGGAERLFRILLRIFPKADVYTSYWDSDKITWLNKRIVKQSFLKNIPKFLRNRKLLTLLYPFAFESFDFTGYDLVISMTAYFAKSVVTKPETKHLCYLFTPPRFLWRFEDLYLSRPNKFLLFPALSYLRSFDYLSAYRPDKYIFLSDFVKRLAQNTYKTTGEVVYPPFDKTYWQQVFDGYKKNKNKIASRFKLAVSRPYFLFVGRLEPYKRVDLFCQEARYFNNCNFIIVGKGSEYKKLLKHKLDNLFFYQDLTDQDLAFLYSNALFTVMPQSEEFGYTALESVFFETPIVTYRESAPAEYARRFSIIFNKQTVSELKTALEKSITLSYNLKMTIKKNKSQFFKQFEIEQFVNKLFNIINQL